MDKVKLGVKAAALCASLVLAICCPHLLTRFFAWKIAFFNVYHLFWLAAVLILVKRMVPGLNPKPRSGKIFRRWLVPGSARVPGMEEKLRSSTEKMNRGALKTAAYWTAVILAIGGLRYLGVIDGTGLFIIVIFFIFMDQFCASVWCPFAWIIGNKCCNTCRINNWGYLMAFAPLVFFPSLWTWSVLTLSAAVVAQWEYLFRRHPERFFELTNAALMCRNCRDRCASRERGRAQGRPGR